MNIKYLYTANTSNTKPEWLLRGYTGHEHLPEFNLINMNGRMYDPLIARMLSPDNYVQSASSTQAYNRYSYAYNNPLKYTDPSGDFIGLFYIAAGTLLGGTGNLIAGGMSNPYEEAYKSITKVVNDFNSSLQVNVYNDKSSRISAGIDPLALGVSVNYTYTKDDVSIGGGVGVGVLSGPFANVGATYSFGEGSSIGIGAGAGSNYYAINANATIYGAGIGYTYAHYGAGTVPNTDIAVKAQNTGAVSILFPGGSFRIENDVLAFEHQDRYRTSAWELSIGNFSLGSYIYTNDPEGEGQERPNHHPSTWKSGKVYSSPLWLGYRIGNSVSRIGYSHSAVQHITQNLMVHRYGFMGLGFGKAPYFKDYSQFQKGIYEYNGYYNPYSLYGR